MGFNRTWEQNLELAWHIFKDSFLLFVVNFLTQWRPPPLYNSRIAYSFCDSPKKVVDTAVSDVFSLYLLEQKE